MASTEGVRQHSTASCGSRKAPLAGYGGAIVYGAEGRFCCNPIRMTVSNFAVRMARQSATHSTREKVD